MINNFELENYLKEYLSVDKFQDYAPNGMQVEGKGEINQICSAVTASLDVINEAVKRQADTLIVHHGYFWKGESAVIQGMKRQRIGRLIENNINLFAYHLPLDAHMDVGNNICLAELLELKEPRGNTVENVENLLWNGSLTNAFSAEEFLLFLTEKLNRRPLLIKGSDKSIKKVAWCSGAAQDFIEQAHALGVDAFISGEISERTYYQARELGIHYFACGHHVTERYGIQALGNYISTKFGLRHYFIDSDNPV